MKTLGLIPARYASLRFPAKPLASVLGVPMVIRVYRQAKKAIDNVVIATDDRRILKTAHDYGAEALMTSPEHPNGTSRCAEALEIYHAQSKEKFDTIINIQGDEPFIAPEQIRALVGIFRKYPDVQIASLMKRIKNTEELNNPDRPKLVKDIFGNALYFSRAPIPYMRADSKKADAKNIAYFKHIGIYGFAADVLKELVKLPQSPLETVEKLEQNRWLENGYKIRLAETEHESFSIDTPEDLAKAEKLYNKK